MNLEKILAVSTQKTIYKDKQTVIKVFHAGYKKADVLNEALNQARMEDTDILIPAIISVEKIGDKWAIISEFIEGDTLSRLMQENPNKMNEYLESFVDTQIHMHDQEPPLLNKLNDKLDREIEKSELNATTRYELRMRIDTLPGPNAICHGDFNPSNIIVTENNEYYILDWSHVSGGNRLADVARTYLLLWNDFDDMLAKKYVERYCLKANVSFEEVKQWLPIVAASQSTKGNRLEKEFLLAWLNKEEDNRRAI